MIADNSDLDRVKPRYLDHLVDQVLDRNQFLSAERTVGGLKGKIVMFLADEALVVKIRTNDQLADKEQIAGFDNHSESACNLSGIVFFQVRNRFDLSISFVVAKRVFDEALPVARIRIR
jgi:hypothetical protein